MTTISLVRSPWPRVAGAVVLVLLTGCANPRPIALDEAQRNIFTAQSDPNVPIYAASELDRARAQLRSADTAYQQRLGVAEVEHRAALASEAAEIARAAAKERKFRAELQSTGMTREQLLRQSAEQQVRALQAELSELRQTDRGLVLTLGDVLFESGQATLRPGATNQLVRLASYLNANPGRRVRIEGHTDNRGSPDLNRDLSQRRAEAASSALIAAGVAPERINAVGMGEDYPIAPNTTAAGRQQNRRVEIIVENSPAG